MQETGSQTIGDYIRTIETNREARLQFECLMAVSISRFFRDRKLWETLQSRILPILAGKENPSVRVWSAGCASGEEPYSLRILREEMKRVPGRFPEFSILATDVCPKYLERARAAVYPPGSMREVPEPVRSTYFEKTEDGKYALRSWLKEGISWKVHDLLSDPPGTGFELVFLRNNLLTYYENELKIPALTKVAGSLAPEGFLIIGSHEKMPVEPADLKQWEGSSQIFQKRP